MLLSLLTQYDFEPVTILLVFFYYLFQLQCFSALHAKHFETDEKTSSRTDEFLVKL